MAFDDQGISYFEVLAHGRDRPPASAVRGLRLFASFFQESERAYAFDIPDEAERRKLAKRPEAIDLEQHPFFMSAPLRVRPSRTRPPNDGPHPWDVMTSDYFLPDGDEAGDLPCQPSVSPCPSCPSGVVHYWPPAAPDVGQVCRACFRASVGLAP